MDTHSSELLLPNHCKALKKKYPQKQDDSVARYAWPAVWSWLSGLSVSSMTKASTIVFSLDRAESNIEPTNGS